MVQAATGNPPRRGQTRAGPSQSSAGPQHALRSPPWPSAWASCSDRTHRRRSHRRCSAGAGVARGAVGTLRARTRTAQPLGAAAAQEQCREAVCRLARALHRRRQAPRRYRRASGGPARRSARMRARASQRPAPRPPTACRQAWQQLSGGCRGRREPRDAAGGGPLPRESHRAPHQAHGKAAPTPPA